MRVEEIDDQFHKNSWILNRTVILFIVVHIDVAFEKYENDSKTILQKKSHSSSQRKPSLNKLNENDKRIISKLNTFS